MRVRVFGAGLAGASVAWALRARGVRVEVVDPRGPAGGASSDNAGMVRSLASHVEERERAVRTARLLASWPDVFARTGAVVALASYDGRHDEAIRHLTGLGHAAVVGRPEALSPMLAGSACGWAVHLPGDGVADAPKLVRRLLGDLLVRPVPSLEVDAEVVATGAWAAPEAGLVAFRRHLVRAHPRSAAVGPWVWVDDAGVYLRPGRDGLLASSCDEEAAPAEPPRGTADEAAVECVQRAVERWFPAVGRLDVRDARFGLRTFAPDRRPVAGPDPDIPGRWRLLGLGGSGVSTSMALGIDLAARIAEQGAR